MLLESGADIHAYEDESLRRAAEFGHTEVVKMLLKSGADARVHQNMAERRASENGHMEIANLLRERERERDRYWHRQGTAQKGEFDEVNALLNAAGTSLRVGRNDDSLILWWASYCGHADIVRALAVAGVDMATNGGEALQSASECGHVDVVKALLESGVDVRVSDDVALRWAAENGRAEIVKTLLDAGADVHVYRDTPLQWAAERGHVEVVKVLLDAGADARTCDDRALITSAYGGHDEVSEMLIKAGARALFWLAGNGRVGLVRAVIKEDSDIRGVPIEGIDKALQEAAFRGHVEVVEALIGAGADLHAENDLALRLASEKGYTEVVQLLHKHDERPSSAPKRMS